MAQNPRPSNIDRALVQAPNDFLSIEEEDLAQQEDDFLNVEVVENDLCKGFRFTRYAV